ncbi:hypothetical protein NLM24_40445 [Nocardia zapadnayensis]|nr:hypothetical protein [Nocardia zapadnayensis]MCX0276795.1 hypothetical protein [Nocardia zapadnayensis]
MLARGIAVREVEAGVRGGLRFEAPRLGQGTGVDDVEADLLDERGGQFLRRRIVSGDGQSRPIGRAGRPGELRDVVREDAAERLP